jgi:hypothetical protein
LDDGWDVIAYWFQRWSAQKDGFIVAGPGSEAQSRASESFKRLHAEGSTPSMRYQVSFADDVPSVDDEICRVSRDGITVIAADFTGLAARCVRMLASTQTENFPRAIAGTKKRTRVSPHRKVTNESHRARTK